MFFLIIPFLTLALAYVRMVFVYQEIVLLEELIISIHKGLYEKALAGEIENFTGISHPYEDPLNPEIIVETNKETPEESTQNIIDYLLNHNFLK